MGTHPNIKIYFEAIVIETDSGATLKTFEDHGNESGFYPNCQGKPLESFGLVHYVI